MALDRLTERSVEIRAAVMLDDGAVVAEHGLADGEQVTALEGLARELLAGADRASVEDPGDVAQVEVGTMTGAVFALREGARAVAVVAERFVLPSLMFYDLLMTLRELRQEAV